MSAIGPLTSTPPNAAVAILPFLSLFLLFVGAILWTAARTRTTRRWTAGIRSPFEDDPPPFDVVITPPHADGEFPRLYTPPPSIYNPDKDPPLC